MVRLFRISISEMEGQEVKEKKEEKVKMERGEGRKKRRRSRRRRRRRRREHYGVVRYGDPSVGTNWRNGIKSAPTTPVHLQTIKNFHHQRQRQH